MKSAHRQAARAKRQRVHAVSTYGLLDTLFAAPDKPMPEAKRTFQLTRMYEGLRAMEQAPNPGTDDWRVVSDAVNLMETLVRIGWCEDNTGLLVDAVAAMALAGARHLQDGAPIRLDGRGIAAVRAVLADYAEMLETLSERTMTQCHRLTERRIYQIQAGQRKAHDVEIMKL